MDEKLIAAVKDYPSMYDVSNKQYKDIEVKDCIWKAISAELKEPGNYSLISQKKHKKYILL